MTDEMEYVVRGESRAQFRRWDNDVPGVRIVRQWLRESLGFENATNDDAKRAQQILRAEFDQIEPRYAPPSNRPKRFRRNPARYTIQTLMGHWGNFTRKADAQAAAKQQREADRQAGNAPGHVKVVKLANPTIKLPSKFTPAEVRVNEEGKVQIRINPAKLTSGRVVKGVQSVQTNPQGRGGTIERQTKRCEVCGETATHIRRKAADLCHACLLLERRQIAYSKRHLARARPVGSKR